MPEVKNTNVPAVWTDAVADTGTTLLYSLGMVRHEDGKIYRYRQFDNGSGDVAAVSGNLAYFIDNGLKVTMDVSDTDRNLVAGVFISVPADAAYCWVQTGGRHATVKTNGDDDVAKGDAIIASAAGDGTADSTAQDTAPTNHVVGWALAADVDANNTVDTYLTLDA